MADGMDFYDVQAMVEKAVQSEKWSRNRHIEDVEKDLRREFRNEVMELREEVGELITEGHQAIRREVHDVRKECAELIASGFTRMAQTSVAQDNELNALRRVVDERTGHLA